MTQKKANAPTPEQMQIVQNMQKEFKEFNEQNKLYDRLNGTAFDGAVHPSLWDVWTHAKKHFTVEQASGMVNYLKFKRMTSFEGLTYNEIGFIFNFIESLNDFKCEQVGINLQLFEEVLEHTYNEMAIGHWNKNVDIWKDEIGSEKGALLEKLNGEIEKLNALTKQKPQSRKERKASNASNLTATKGTAAQK